MPIDAHQEDILIKLVEASRRGTREQPSFSYTEPPGGRPRIEHAGLREDLVLAKADIDILAHQGYLTHRQVIVGTGSFELTPRAYEAYTEIRQHRGEDKLVRLEPASAKHDYVAPSRIDELRAIRNKNFDLARLIRLCEELNSTWTQDSHHATAMLVRAIMDHVPPIFGAATFAAVANNYTGSKSFKETMAGLDSAARKIGDAHLHTQIRPKEVLPTATQVNFSQTLDVLLAEIVRILR
jgi:hypothetical protein